MDRRSRIASRDSRRRRRHCAQVKVIFLVAVCEWKKISFVRLELKEKHMTHTDLVTGETTKGFGAAFLDHILRRVARNARTILGPGPIAFWLDMAPRHRAKKM
jgi:hypothetical protein